ncbi:MAG: carboxypeptidase-like regulatory domain-containing protein [Nitrospira sp.]|nr:carboxypeptidase-like regulatory domain-containing protein [Nitrospira sp.]MCP9442385.1 carboxypeptidase-like regulatory domain-containing protein [Nitrospira sp.]
MRSSWLVMLSAVAVAVVAAPVASFAGGTISGKVTYAGKSEQKEFLFSKFPNPNFCNKIPTKGLAEGDKRFLKTIEVGKDGGLKNAVIAVADIEDKAFMDGYSGTEVKAEFCDFQPFSGIVVNNRPFKVENTDADPDDPKSVAGVLHNPHSFVVKGSTSATGFNIGLAKKGDRLEKPVVFRGGAEKEGYFRLQCDQHEFMQSFFLPVSNPYYAVTKEDGSFEIKDVPAGKHKVVAWHPFAGKAKRVEFEVEVTDGGTANLKAEIK